MFDRKYKIPQYQNGRAYLTSHRICYVDNAEPRKYSVGVDLKDVDTTEYYVCAVFRLSCFHTDNETGRLPEVLAESHALL